MLRSEIIPQLIAPERGGDQIRVWSVGCATGEEPYSLAMLLAEALGPDEYTRRVKIYGTDLDEAALSAGRRGIYNAREIEGVPADLLEKYFDRSMNGQNVISRELRKSVIFGRHNVVSDAPISRIDLLVCRNLLIYLETETQSTVLPRLHYALVDDGVLFLGKAETQLARSKLFHPLNMKHRLFRKVKQDWRRLPGGGVVFSGELPHDRTSTHGRIVDAIVDTGAAAYLAVDTDGRLVFTNLAVRRLLEIAEDDVGRPFQDLSISYRPIELRVPIEEALQQGRVIRIEHQEFQHPPAEPVRLTIEVLPLMDRNGTPFAALIKFSDTTRLYMLQQEVEAAQSSLENTIEELQSSNEELETTNEELQSTNEELETTNEELQSTNEELETANEEHRSTNEELEATLEELRRRSDASNEYKRYADAVIASIDSGIVVLDNDLLVQAWNRWSENVWGVRADEVIGQHFLDLDFGLPAARLRDDLLRAVTHRTGADRTVTGMDRRGRTVQCRVRIAPLSLPDGSSRGVMLIIEDHTQFEQDAAHADYLGRVVGKALNEVYFLDPDTLRFTLINHGVERSLGYRIAQLRTMTLADLMPGVSIARLRGLIQPLLDGQRDEIVFGTVLRARGGEERPAQICLQFFKDEDPPLLLAVAHNTSELQKLEA